jgi:hypothetical protein
MLADMHKSASRICIVIPTYKRNDRLLQVVHQCRELIDRYHGHNLYEICVTDSDPNNPIAPLPLHLGVTYSLNPGTGFDDNLYYFWLNNIDRYDFIFSISDDDMFTTWLNPLYLLDAAIDTGNQVMMFNHRYYRPLADGKLELGAIVYPDPEFVVNKKLFLQRILTTLPSHIATLYSTKLLRITLETVSEFRNTLHLYAVPILLAAAANTLLFSDYVLCLYDSEFKTDGAWSVSENVIHGLADFLVKLKKLLPHDLYTIAEQGFFKFYFGSDCWIRKQIGDNPRLKSEEQIREMIVRC